MTRLEDCILTFSRQGKIDPRFQETYDKLIEIRNHLERLTMTQAWSLRETDLFMWQRKLDRIDDTRRDGNFHDADGRPADLHAQRVSVAELLRGTMLTHSRHFCILSAEDMPTYTNFSSHRNQSLKHSYPSITNSLP